jgi:hypothetical protein
MGSGQQVPGQFAFYIQGSNFAEIVCQMPLCGCRNYSALVVQFNSCIPLYSLLNDIREVVSRTFRYDVLSFPAASNSGKPRSTTAVVEVETPRTDQIIMGNCSAVLSGASPACGCNGHSLASSLLRPVPGRLSCHPSLCDRLCPSDGIPSKARPDRLCPAQRVKAHI